MVDILFINATSTLTLEEEVNGTMILATKLLQAGFETKVLRFGQFESNGVDYSAFIADITNEILELSPKCISFYSLWPYYHVLLRIAREVRERNSDIVIVFGGPQASATAYETMKAMPFVDYICTGEGEDTVVPFFQALLGEEDADLNSVPGLYHRQNGQIVFNDILVPLSDLNNLPRWDERLYLEDYQKAGLEVDIGNRYMPIDAGRGCPYSCTFCCTSHFWRRTYRLKSAQTIVDDILYYRTKYGIKKFWFSHDAFTVDKALVAQVCDKLIEAGLTDIEWKCTSRIDCITEELIEKMIRSGLREIELGVETGSPRMQKVINKNLRLEKVKDTVAFLLKNKLQIGMFFMYGFPEETEEDLNQTLEMVCSLLDMGVQYVSMYFCRFNPQTAITETYIDDLVLDPEIKILVHTGAFGYYEELDMIQNNKALFPFFYHLNTELRNEFQYTEIIVSLYKKFRKTMARLRACYQGDNIALYRDFIRANKHVFDSDYAQILQMVAKHPDKLVDNLICASDRAGTKQLRAILEFEADCVKVSKAKEDIILQKVYDFSYIELKLNLPVEKLSEGKTEVLLQKKSGKMGMKILRIE